VPSFINTKDMIGAKCKKRVTWPWPRPQSGSLLSKDTWHILPAYKIWRHSLQPFQRYYWRLKNL